MAGELTGFDAAVFRENITNTMIMGLPNDTALKPTFHFRNTTTWPTGTVLDPEGKPIDVRVAPTVSSASRPVQVPCAVEFAQDSTNNEGLAGTFWSDRVTLTLLDTQWSAVDGAVEVDISGRRYIIGQMIAIGLGPVTVYQLQCYRKGTGND